MPAKFTPSNKTLSHLTHPSMLLTRYYLSKDTREPVPAEFSLLAGGILNSEANCRILKVTFLISEIQEQINFLKVGTLVR